MTNRVIGNEDCLYLNVFAPAQVVLIDITFFPILFLIIDAYQEESNEKLQSNLAVMVFIHGGIFNFGSGSLDEYSPDYLLDENVVVVTINYRLNALGECTKIQSILVLYSNVTHAFDKGISNKIKRFIFHRVSKF